ncbi:hypothetical protein [Corynebacterium matruchotii]|uniref:hypothetical protein n=1 Tax=Corynebacterium matruchotii TaxID=43768 RepID=UPI00360DCB13
MGRPRATVGPPDRRKFGRLLPACAEVLVCRQTSGRCTWRRLGRSSPGAGLPRSHSLLAVWRQVVGCRLRLPRLVAVPAAPSVGQHQVISRRPRPWACEGARQPVMLGQV